MESSNNPERFDSEQNQNFSLASRFLLIIFNWSLSLLYFSWGISELQKYSSIQFSKCRLHFHTELINKCYLRHKTEFKYVFFWLWQGQKILKRLKPFFTYETPQRFEFNSVLQDISRSNPAENRKIVQNMNFSYWPAGPARYRCCALWISVSDCRLQSSWGVQWY